MNWHFWDTCTVRAEAREHLHRMTTQQISNGLRAFDHPPRNSFRPHGLDAVGCFVGAAFGCTDNVLYRALAGEFDALSKCYENYHGALHNDNDWLRTECLRELAERGGAGDPVPGFPGVMVKAEGRQPREAVHA